MHDALAGSGGWLGRCLQVPAAAPIRCCDPHSLARTAHAQPMHSPCTLPPPPPPAAPQTYMPAWEAPQGSPADAMREFEAALRQVAPEARLVEAASTPGSEFRRYQVGDPLFDHDDIE